jgi:hypothetical protein
MKGNNLRKQKYKTARGQKRFELELSRKTYTANRPVLKKHSNGDEYIVLFSPERLSIYDINNYSAYIDTLNFINDIKKYAGRAELIIDFQRTSHLKAAALVTIYSVIDQLVDIHGVFAKVKLSKDVRVNKLIRTSNLKKLIEGRDLPINLFGSETLPIIKGVGAEYTEEIVDFIQLNIYKNKMDPEDESICSNAIYEVIENVCNHAYPESEESKKSWWLLANVIGNQLFLAICDSGIGIPNTIVGRSWFKTNLKSMYPEQYESVTESAKQSGTSFAETLKLKSYLKDKDLINLSMKGDVSGTIQRGRGQGSKSIKELVTENSNGKLWVFSKSGLYMLIKKDTGPNLYELPKTFPGTLVQWNIEVK